MKTFLSVLLTALFVGHTAHAGYSVLNSAGKVLGFAAATKCGAGLTCTLGTSAAGPLNSITVAGGAGSFTTLSASGVFSPNGGIAESNATNFSYYTPFQVTSTSSTNNATSTTPSSTLLYVTPVFVPANSTLKGIAVDNGTPCGTNTYIVALFSAAGAALANSSIAGTTCSGTNAWQDIPFTASVAVTGPAMYFAGVYMNGNTDRFFTVPAAGEFVGPASTISGQSFGAVVAMSTIPASFSANSGVVVHTY